MQTDVQCQQQKTLGVITLNRPKALNALTHDMIVIIYEQLKKWEKDNTVHAVVIRSEGDKAFCAGGDVRWLYEHGRHNLSACMDFFRDEYRLNQYIANYPKPYIALMQGMTMGGGVGVSLHGNYPIAGEQFQFAMPETTIGFFPDIGSSYLLGQCPGAIGMYLGLTGQRITAQDALYCGLIKFIIPADAFPELLDVLSKLDLQHDSKKQLDNCLINFSPPKTPASGAIAENIEKINTYFSVTHLDETLLKLRANSQDPWAQSVLQTLLQKSPLSLFVTFSQLQRTKSLSLVECLDIDYTLVKNFMRGHDFYEGVRALLIDKDNSPQWTPANLAEVNKQMVDDYFKRQ